jgi:hypothetical protein
MDIDLDTFLTAVYSTIDDLYHEQFAAHKPARPGAAPVVSDSEVLTLEVLGQWFGRAGERRYLRYVRREWRAYFPRTLSQSAYNRRVRDLLPTLAALGPALAGVVEAVWDRASVYEVLDCVPVPLARRCRGRRGKLFAGTARLGRGGSDRAWYYGVHLLLAVRPSGAISGWNTAPADTGERWQAEALLRWRADPELPAPTAEQLAPVLGPTHLPGGQRLGPTGRLGPIRGAGQPAPGPYLGDLGFTGARWAAPWRAAYGATLLTKTGLPAALARSFSAARQIVETVHGWLAEHLALAFPRARTPAGLWACLGAKIAAFNCAVLLNHLFGRPTFSLLGPLD